MLKDVTKKSYEKPCLEMTAIVSDCGFANLLSGNTQTETDIKSINYANIKNY